MRRSRTTPMTQRTRPDEQRQRRRGEGPLSCAKQRPTNGTQARHLRPTKNSGQCTPRGGKGRNQRATGRDKWDM